MLRSSLFVALFAALSLSACGAPGSIDVCHSGCDAGKRCGTLTDAMAANCHTACNNNQGTYQDQDAADDKRCKNAGDVRKQLRDCADKECNKIATCVQTVDNTCVTR